MTTTDDSKTFVKRLCTITIQKTTPDFATVTTTVAGKEIAGIVLVTDWYSDCPWHEGDTALALQLTPGSQPTFSVAHLELLEAVFEGLSPEIRNGTVRIMGVSRVPGVRAKVAVASIDKNIDPIRACVGKSANRVAAASKYCNGERIEIVQWSRNIEKYVAASLAPSEPTSVIIDGEDAVVSVPAHQMSAAVGRSGLNSQLAGNLVGLRVQVVPQTD